MRASNLTKCQYQRNNASLTCPKTTWFFFLAGRGRLHMVKLSYVLTIYTAWCFQGDNFIYLQSIASIGNIWQSYVQMNSKYFVMKGDVNQSKFSDGQFSAKLVIFQPHKKDRQWDETRNS